MTTSVGRDFLILGGVVAACFAPGVARAAQPKPVAHPAITAVHRALDAAAASARKPAGPTPHDTGDGGFRRFVRREASLEVQIGLRLYAQGDDYRAITALKRYQILSGHNPGAQYLAAMMIGQIYHRNHKPGLAITYFQQALQFTPPSSSRQVYTYLMGLQESCLVLSLYGDCHQRLRALSKAPLNRRLRDLVHYQLLFSDVVLRAPHLTDASARRLTDPQLRAKALGLVGQNQAFDHLDLQHPWLAGVLSAVLPGAGQAYNGRWADAGIALALNAIFGAATYYSFGVAHNITLGVVSSIFAAGFYAGNIVNAVVDAHRINAGIYEHFFHRLKANYWPRVAFQIRDDQVSFVYRFDWPGTPKEKPHSARASAVPGNLL